LAASIHPHKTVLLSTPGFLQLGINLLIIHGDAELAIHVAHRDAVMLLIMRIKCNLGNQDIAISLIGIDDSGANACMGVNASHDNLLAIEVLEIRIQLCPKKGAVAFHVASKNLPDPYHGGAIAARSGCQGVDVCSQLSSICINRGCGKKKSTCISIMIMATVKSVSDHSEIVSLCNVR
jgi:hypothetical protein